MVSIPRFRLSGLTLERANPCRGGHKLGNCWRRDCLMGAVVYKLDL